MNRFAGLLAVFEQAGSNTSIGITGKRRALVIEALRIAAATEEATMPETTPHPDEMLTSLTLMFPYKRIAEMVCTAIETPVGDWFLRSSTSDVADRTGISNSSGPWYSQGAFWSKPDAAILVTVDNPVNDGNGDTLQKRLTVNDFTRALALMATKDDGAYSHHFADFLRNNEDANTADLFMQFAVYGDEVYS